MKYIKTYKLFESGDLGFDVEKDHPFFDIEETENETSRFKTLFFNFYRFKSFLEELGVNVGEPILNPIRDAFDSPAMEFEITMNISSPLFGGEISPTQFLRLEEFLKDIPYTSDSWVSLDSVRQSNSITLEFETGDYADDADFDEVQWRY